MKEKMDNFEDLEERIIQRVTEKFEVEKNDPSSNQEEVREEKAEEQLSEEASDILIQKDETEEKREAENEEIEIEKEENEENEEIIVEEQREESAQGYDAVSKPRRTKKIAEEDFEKDTEPSRVLLYLEGYAKKIWSYRTHRWVRISGVALLILISAIAGTMWVKYRTYGNYEVVKTSKQEDTVSTQYLILGNNMLKYSMDGATLIGEGMDVIWTKGYDMKNPQAVRCGDTIALYDKNGTSIVILDEKGVKGEVSTKLPIIRAEVAEQGVVTVILQDTSDTWISYYNTDGSEIAALKGKIDAPGYPMDIALSKNGIVMGVSYLTIEDGQPDSRIVFYNFGNMGQNQPDNIVKQFEHKGRVIPQLDYMGEDTFVAFQEDGFTIFRGDQAPEKVKKVEVPREILSTFYNEQNIGVIYRSGEEDQAFVMGMYDKRGKEVFSTSFDFDYTDIAVGDESIILYNDVEVCVFSNKGVRKFQGSIEEGKINQVFPMAVNQCMIAGENGLSEIRFK